MILEMGGGGGGGVSSSMSERMILQGYALKRKITLK